MLRGSSRILLAVLAACASAHAATPDSPSLDRLSANRAAHEAFLGFHLFHDGRGMHSAPGMIDAYEHWRQSADVRTTLLLSVMRDDMGIAFDEQEHAVGLFVVGTASGNVGVFGCAVCHCGKVDGHIVPGLGSKNIDPYALGRSGAHVQRLLHFLHSTPESTAAADVEAQSYRFLDKLGHEPLANRTQGLVPTAIIWEWFFEQAQRAMPVDTTPGAVKVPALWGFGAKRGAGSLCDGFGRYDERSAWAVMTELVGGQTPSSVEQYLDRVSDLEESFAHLLPPAYPRGIDADLAARGRHVFQRTCQRCHGRYERDRDGLAMFQPPKHVPISVVSTDQDRLRLTTPEFAGLVASSPIAGIVGVNPDYVPGYFAPRLEGIWARFPYLHNASVPNMASLLTPPNERPDVFDLAHAGETYRFDDQNLGLTVPAAGTPEELQLRERAAAGARNVYDVRRIGQSNAGHDFGTHLSDAEKRALLEYLKTL